MALGTPIELGRTTGSSSSSSTALTITPTLGRTVYAFISAVNGAVKPTISDTDGHVWAEVNNVSGLLCGTCYQTVGKGNSTTVTAVTTTTNAGTTLALVEFPGAGTDASNNGGYAGNEFDPPVINLSAFAPTSGAFLWSAVQGGSPTLSSGMTSLALTSANNRGIRTQYDLTSPSTAFSWVDSLGNEGKTVGVAFEIKEPGGSDITGTLAATLSGAYTASFTGTVSDPAPTTAAGGGGYRRPVIYLDGDGNPVDLETYRRNKAGDAARAAKTVADALPAEDQPEARARIRALKRAIKAQSDERIAEEAARLASVMANADRRLSRVLDELDRIAKQEAEDEEAALFLLLS
jgi:hypothetical protein